MSEPSATMEITQEIVNAKATEYAYSQSRASDEISVILIKQPDGTWGFLEDDVVLNAYADYHPTYAKPPVLGLTADAQRVQLDRLAQKGCHRSFLAIYDGGGDPRQAKVAILGFRRPGALPPPPARCDNCGNANEWGAVNGPENTFTCYSCRQDPWGRRLR